MPLTDSYDDQKPLLRRHAACRLSGGSALPLRGRPSRFGKALHKRFHAQIWACKHGRPKLLIQLLCKMSHGRLRQDHHVISPGKLRCGLAHQPVMPLAIATRDGLKGPIDQPALNLDLPLLTPGVLSNQRGARLDRA